MVYVHTNLRRIYRKREEWVKGKTKMWDVFPNDMGLDSSIELALANMDVIVDFTTPGESHLYGLPLSLCRFF